MAFVSNVLKCHNVFHHLFKFEIVVDQLNDEDVCFDIFEMTIRTTKLIKELMNRELSMFLRYQVDAKGVVSKT